MGLDMYLNKVKRIGDASLNEILETERYIDWQKRPMDRYADCIPEEWNGCDIKYVRMDLLEEVRKEYIHRYPVWDEKHEYGFETIQQEVAYWRKANQIHDWFVNNVQDGNDDCECYEVSEEQLRDLLDICIKVRDGSELVDGKVLNGITYDKDGEHKNWEDGKVIKDPSIAKELLPTCHGFFFGGDDYDEWYYEAITYTIDALTKILSETDFEHEIVFYHSSW